MLLSLRDISSSGFGFSGTEAGAWPGCLTVVIEFVCQNNTQLSVGPAVGAVGEAWQLLKHKNFSIELEEFIRMQLSTLKYVSEPNRACKQPSADVTKATATADTTCKWPCDG